MRPTILIVEGTRFKNSEKINRTEEDVYNASYDEIKKHQGKLVIVDFGPRNIERMETFLQIAKDTGRKLLITYRDAILLHLLKENNINILDDDNIGIFYEKDLDTIEVKKPEDSQNNKNQNKNCSKEINKTKDISNSDKTKINKKYIKDLYKSKIIKPDEINKNLGKFILCFSFFDFKHLLDLDIRKDDKEDGHIYIYSSSEAFTEEQEFDIKRLFNWINYFNLNHKGIDLINGEPNFTDEFHSSGHASFDDIKWMINEINPEYILPIHTENIDEFISIFGEKKVIKDVMFSP